MSDKRKITKADILLEARLRAEGCQIEVKGLAKKWEHGNIYQAVVLEGCDMVIGLWHNPNSRLKAIFEGNDAVILDGQEELGRGTPEARAHWRDKRLSDGTPVQSADIPWNADILTIILNRRGCSHAGKGKACKYCFMAAIPAGAAEIFKPSSDFKTSLAKAVEAVIIALQSGWRGEILFSGGTPPRSRHEKLTGEMERILDQIREAVGEEVLNQNQIAEALFSPPDDLGLLYKWRDIGLNSTEFDTQIVSPDYFKAICPGRGDQARWDDAQTASAEVFGRGRGATTGIVLGLEPMDGLLEGIEDRVSRGVFTQLFNFIPIPGGPYGGMMPPSAQWFVTAAEKIVDIYLKYADTFDVDLTEDERFGYTRKGRSFYISIVDDEFSRRLQEMGKLGPGLPKQDGLHVS
jgi:hypothetical protein